MGDTTISNLLWLAAGIIGLLFVLFIVVGWASIIKHGPCWGGLIDSMDDSIRDIKLGKTQTEMVLGSCVAKIDFNTSSPDIGKIWRDSNNLLECPPSETVISAIPYYEDGISWDILKKKFDEGVLNIKPVCKGLDRSLANDLTLEGPKGEGEIIYCIEITKENGLIRLNPGVGACPE